MYKSGLQSIFESTSMTYKMKSALSESFQRTQQKLVAAARRAKQEIAEGQATALDYDQL